MATHHRGIGKPLEKDSDPQEHDGTIHNEYQAKICEFENVEPDHQAGLRDLTSQIEQLRQTVEANGNDPMDTIHHLKHKHNRLALTLHLSTTLSAPIEEVLHQYTNTLYTVQKKHVFCKHFITRYRNFEQKQFFTIRRYG